MHSAGDRYIIFHRVFTEFSQNFQRILIVRGSWTRSIRIYTKTKLKYILKLKLIYTKTKTNIY